MKKGNSHRVANGKKGDTTLKRDAPLDDLGAETQNRTGDTRIFSPLLYRLSYLGILIVGTGEENLPHLSKRL